MESIKFAVFYGICKIDSHDNPTGCYDEERVYFDNLESAKSALERIFESQKNELLAHSWATRQKEKAFAYISAFHVDEDGEYVSEAWEDLSQWEKDEINEAVLEAFGRDLEHVW